MKYEKIILSIESQHTPSFLFLFGVMHLVHLLGKGTCGEEEHQGAGLSLSNKMPRQGLLQGHDEQAHAVASLVGVNSQDYCSSGLESILTHIGYQHLGPFNVSSMDDKNTGASYSTQGKLPALISESMDHVPSQSLGLANFGSVSSLQRFKNSINSGFNVLGGARSRFERSGRDYDHHLKLAAVRMKKDKGRRKMREPRFCFKTLSDVDVLDDGYKWRKYGQKVVKNTLHPRSYYRCTQDNCRVKKKVERLAEDPRMVITTYEGRHAHSPSHEQNDDSNSFNPPASIPHHFKLFW